MVVVVGAAEAQFWDSPVESRLCSKPEQLAWEAPICSLSSCCDVRQLWGEMVGHILWLGWCLIWTSWFSNQVPAIPLNWNQESVLLTWSKEQLTHWAEKGRGLSRKVATGISRIFKADLEPILNATRVNRLWEDSKFCLCPPAWCQLSSQDSCYWSAWCPSFLHIKADLETMLNRWWAEIASFDRVQLDLGHLTLNTFPGWPGYSPLWHVYCTVRHSGCWIW